MSLPEEELLCPICCDIFTDPVLLPCSHSFCKGCLKRHWDTSGLRECPVCRKRFSRCAPTSNLALKNLCEAVLHRRSQSSELEKELMICELHGERFKLFCLVDKQPICIICQTSKVHKTHDCCPLDEAAQDCKNELGTTLRTLRDQLCSHITIHETAGDMLNHIKSQAVETQRIIKSQFEQLHQVLHEEETARLTALKKEEDEKVTIMKEMMVETAAEISSLREAIDVLELELEADDMTLLQNFKATLERGNIIPHGTESFSGSIIDVTKHICNLKYRIWEKMQDHTEYTPVILDPSTAHPRLILSEDLTSVHYSSQPRKCPDNPERFHLSAEVVGMSAFGSGGHRWVVDTGSNQDWILGVASVSVPRNEETSARPENGFWTLCLRDGEFRAMTSPPTTLTIGKEKPKRIKVQLDYDKGTLSFFNCENDTLLYSFNQTFKETLLPYFYTQSTSPLRILPENVYVTVMHR